MWCPWKNGRLDKGQSLERYGNLDAKPYIRLERASTILGLAYIISHTYNRIVTSIRADEVDLGYSSNNGDSSNRHYCVA